MTHTETEKNIREHLEATGQLGKMRAMVIDAALHSLHGDPQSVTGSEHLFLPRAAFVAAKSTPEGVLALRVVYDYLQRMGLPYTASVLALEAGVTTDSLQQDVATTLEALLDGDVALKPSAPSTTTTAAPPIKPLTPLARKDALIKSSSVSGADSEEDADSARPDSPSAATSDAGDAPEQGETVGPAGGEDTTFFISTWRGKSFLRHGQVAGQQLQLEYLDDCQVMVLDPLDSITVDDCEGGELIIAACEGSVFLRNCKNMTVHVVCKQLRARDCENIELHIFTTTDPVVEMSHHMSFRPFHLRLPDLVKSFNACRLNPKLNRFVHVYDFTVDEPSLPKPHFTVHYPDHGCEMEDCAGDLGTPECPPEIEALLSGALLPAESSESGQNKSYNIKTGAQVWAAATTATTVSRAEAEAGSIESGSGESTTSEESGKAHSPVATAAGGRPPIAKPVTVTTAATPGGLDNQDYSSFDDEDSTGMHEDDKYEVEEDDDDF